MPVEVDVQSSTQEAQVAALNAERTLFVGAQAHLYKDTLSPSFDSVLADFLAEEADFAGYAAATVVWGVVGADVEGQVSYEGGASDWLATDGVTPNMVAGIFLTTAAAAAMIAFYQFATPIPMTAALHFIRARIRRSADRSGQVTVES